MMMRFLNGVLSGSKHVRGCSQRMDIDIHLESPHASEHGSPPDFQAFHAALQTPAEHVMLGVDAEGESLKHADSSSEERESHTSTDSHDAMQGFAASEVDMQSCSGEWMTPKLAAKLYFQGLALIDAFEGKIDNQ